MAADADSLAEQLLTPLPKGAETPKSRLSEEEAALLGLKELQAEPNEALRMQILQRVMIRMAAHDMSLFAIQHELNAINFPVPALRLRAILDSPLVREQVAKLRRSFGERPTTEEEALAAAAPDCIRLLHQVVASPFLRIDPGNGTEEQLVPVSTGDRLFAAKQLLDRYAKTAPVSHRKHTHTQKGLVTLEDLQGIKEAHARALRNESTGGDA